VVREEDDMCMCVYIEVEEDDIDVAIDRGLREHILLGFCAHRSIREHTHE
jgi:hypothetical protein